MLCHYCQARKGLSEMGFGDEQVEAAVLNCPGKGFAKTLQWVMSSMVRDVVSNLVFPGER